MPRSSPPAGERKTRRAIVKLLKTEGPLDSARLAKKLRLTAMAVRQHLYELEREKLVTFEERPVPVGRPAKYWQLTRQADHLFPDAYAELNVALIDALEDAFGAAGIERVLQSRFARQRADYAQRIPAGAPLAEKLRRLARIRTEEGYMAQVTPDGSGGFLLVENHCPICTAAAACKGLCATELDLFRQILGPDATVERSEHIVSGDRRCVYSITPASRTASSRKASP